MTFSFFDSEQLSSYLSPRDGETKLGEKIQLISNWSDLDTTKARFVVIGVEEDIGPRANCGNGGAKNAWNAFLGKFLNMQSNHLLSGETIVVAGSLVANSSTEELSVLREEVNTIDEALFDVIQSVVEHGKIPIVIGGGHNNCFPIIKGVSSTKGSAIHTVNIDPHADLRALEGRHSGNGFTQAMHDNYLDKYYIIGLHEQYNSAFIWNKILSSERISCTTYEAFLDGASPSLAIRDAIVFCGDRFGLELDMDAIAGMPASAFTPTGFSLDSARSLIRGFAEQAPYYLHLPEAAPNNDGEKAIAGKGLAYLVTDFVKRYPY